LGVAKSGRQTRKKKTVDLATLYRSIYFLLIGGNRFEPPGGSASQWMRWRVLMKCLTLGILALSVTLTATVALAADYEIFAATATVAPGVNFCAVERLDHKNKQLYQCSTVLDIETKKLTDQCTERPGFPQRPAVEGPNVQGAMSAIVGRLPLGIWQIDRTTGKTEFCTLGPTQCIEVTPK
jgi:hypothetical protein